jgi:hypothetical protein
MSEWLKKHGWRVAIAALIFGLAVYASDRHGVPSDLPTIALGWRLLFHLERAAALLAAIGIVLLVGWRALQGDFPLKFGQVEYAAKEAAASSENATKAQERRIQFLEAILGIADPPPEEEDSRDAERRPTE